MRQERLYTLLGLFVFGAISMTLVGVIFIYQQYIHSKAETYVMFFNGSLNGLGSTTPVTYRGVKIGQVTRIEVTSNPKTGNVEIPVYVEFFVEKGVTKEKNPIIKLIQLGLKANITKPNLLTGIADIELTQDTSSRRATLKKYHGYPIYPTITIEEKPITIDKALKAAESMLNDLSALIKSKEVKDSINSIDNMAKSFTKLTQSIDRNVPTVVAYFNQSLKQITRAAYSTENLTDYLSRNPEALLRGKP